METTNLQVFFVGNKVVQHPHKSDTQDLKLQRFCLELCLHGYQNP